ncbi:MAG: lipoprotein [Gemmatimonadota bacterium]
MSVRRASTPIALTALLALSLIPRPVSAQAAPGPGAFKGTWEGQLDAGAVKLRLVFHVTVGADGTLGGTLDSPDQGAAGIPATSVSASGPTLTFAIAALGVRYVATLSSDGATLAGTFNQGGASLPLSLKRTDAPAPPPERPQNPKEPLPYRALDVELPGGAPGVTLSGTLTLPPGSGPFPAAVLVSGSGPQDRDEALMGHKPFLVLSDHLTRSGVAVLRYDDRGVAKSTGDFQAATTEDFAADALAAVRFLRARADMGTVGIVGHSEGGLVGPLAASRSADVGFVVMLAGPGLTGEEIVQLQSELIGRADGAAQPLVEANLETQRRLFQVVRSEPDPSAAAPRLEAILREAMAALPEEARRAEEARQGPNGLAAQVRQVNGAWFRFFLTYDPRPTLERVRVPVLALNGALDLQVPAEANLAEVDAALRRGGNTDVTTRLLPGLNHLFQTATTGSPTEYARISETMSSVALEAVSSWILERFGPGR